MPRSTTTVDPLLEAGALGQAVEHGGERRAVLGISGKHLVGDRKALAADDQPDDDLLAVRSMIARIAPLGLGIADTLTLEVGRGQIVEIDRRIEVEQAALALNQRRLDNAALRMQLVEHQIERVFLERLEVDAENVGERCTPDPIRHGVLGARRDQPIERHGAGQVPRRCRQLAVAQDVVEPQTPPELVADMDRTGFPMALGRYPRRIDLDQPTARPLRRRRQRLIIDAAVPMTPGAPRPHPTNDVGDLTIVRIEQIALADQRVLDLADKLQPLLAWPRTQIAERADRPLAWSFRCLNRFHQQVVDVRLVPVGPRRLADVHAPLRIANQPHFKRKYRPQLVTILPNHAPPSSSPKQFQRLATDRTRPTVKNRPQKMEVGLARSSKTGSLFQKLARAFSDAAKRRRSTFQKALFAASLKHPLRQ